MLPMSVCNKGLGFEKYLFSICMLIGVHCIAFAQDNPGISAGDATARYCDEGVTSLNVVGPDASKANLNGSDYVYQIKKGGSVTLSVSSFMMNPTQVKWERKTTKDGLWQLVDTKPSTESLKVNDINADVLYRATFDNGFGGVTDQRALLAVGVLSSDVSSACPNEAVELKIEGGTFAYRSEWWIGFGAAEEKKVKEYADGTSIYTVNASGEPLKSHVVLKYDEFNCSRSSVSPRFESNKVDVKVETNCKKECMQTSTGDYYVGTDFDPNKANPSIIPDDIESHFSDYEIDFDKTDFSGYWLGSNAHGFFGQDPAIDREHGVVGSNNYLFAQGNKYNDDGTFQDGDINADIVKLRFQVWDNRPDVNKSGVKGKSYRYKMRMYIQADNCHIPISQAWSNAKFKPETRHGRQSNDCIEAYAYDNETGEELGHTVVNDGNWILFKDVFDISDINTNQLIRFEVVFYGTFPENPNQGLNYFEFTPRFEQFGCAKLALDYISAEIENVCLSPNVQCIGDSATANAAGFPRNSKYEWYKKRDDGSWELMPEISGAGDKYSKVKIKAEKIGKAPYKVRVTADGYEREFEFIVGGKNCDIQKPTAIEGNGVFCLPNVYGYKPNIVDEDESASYKWHLVDPSGNTLYVSEKFGSSSVNPNFFVSSEKGDSLTIKLDETAKEGDYTLELHTFSGSSEKGDPVSMKLYVYRTPDISLVLYGDKFGNNTNEKDKTLCPSDVRRNIVAVAENAFECDSISLYKYYWNSKPIAPGVIVPRNNADSADVHVEAIPGICNGDVDSVYLSVRADIKGCSNTATNPYKVDALGEISIDCSSLVGTKDTFFVPNKKEETNVRIPIPTFSSGCDYDPNVIIEFTPKREEVKDTMGSKTISVFKSEIDTIKSLDVVLPWGEYAFNYTIKDGCGRTESCPITISVVKRTLPGIPCDSILDIDVVSGQFNEGASNKCMSVLDAVTLPIPSFIDQNDERGTRLTGIYSGRRQSKTQQNSDSLRDLAQHSAAERAKFDMTLGLYDEYEYDYTYILWRFTNDAGNSSYCVQEVLIRDTVKPYFDCNTIDPFVFRPLTKKGECEIKFVDFWDELMNKHYTAYDSCPLPVTPVLGELHEDSVAVSTITSDRIFKVGVPDTVYWQFRDPHDYGDKVKYCPQVINAFADTTISADCESIAYREGIAEKGTCEANAKDLNIPSPEAIEPCTDIVVKGVGTRSDGKALDDPYPVDSTIITWIFKGENSFPDTCKTVVFVKGNKDFEIACDVLFPDKSYEMPDCDSMLIDLEPKSVPDPCVAGYMVESVPYLINGLKSKKISTPYKFPIGETIVTWMFWDKTHSVSHPCFQSIHLRDTFPPDVKCDTLRDSEVELQGVCEIPYADLRDSLGNKYALEHCTQDTIWGEPYLLDTVTGQRREFPAVVKVGIYPIQWVFANDSLTTKEKPCDKTLYLRSNMKPPFDCDDLKDIQLLDTVGICKIILDQNKLPLPKTHDACVLDYDVYGHGYVQLYGKGEYKELCYFDRNSKKAVYLMDLPLGGHEVKWVFESIYSTAKDSCYQKVNANSYALDSIHCEDLAQYVHVTLLRQGAGATFKEVVDSGLIVPKPWDPCLVLDTIYTRNDGMSIYDIYPVNTITYITWTFKDTTENTNRPPKVCHTTVEVQDGDTPICVIRKFDNVFTCLEEAPAPYETFQELLDDGGMLVSNGADVSSYVDNSSFKLDTISLGDKCNYTLVRKYSINNLRSQTVVCKQEFKMKDTIAPVWLDEIAASTKVFDCEIVDFFPQNIRANDECSSNILSTSYKVESLKGVKDGVFYTETSNRSSNPEDCEYYNYKVERHYVAVDRCSNYSNELSFVAEVQDTFAPIINMPDTAQWRTKFVPAKYAPGCTFLYPDLTTDFPKDVLSDECDPASAKYFKITQTPAAGSVIKNTKEKQYVTLHITDPCGLEDTLMKEIFVQDSKDMIDLTFEDTTVCAESKLVLSDLSSVSGQILSVDWYTGEYVFVKNANIEYDYYKTGVNVDSLIFSNNSRTYKGKFPDFSVLRDYHSLKSLDETGWYVIVAMDTVRHCVDTAAAYITVHSSPTIYLDKASLSVCEYDSIHLVSDEENLYEKYNISVYENGEEITEEGWMLNGVKYEPQSLVDYSDNLMKLQYYAINACGPNSSNDWVSISMRHRMNPDNFMLTTEPNNPPRVFINESASLNLVTQYQPDVLEWYCVKGVVDGRSDVAFDKYGNVREEYINYPFEPDSLMGVTTLGESDYKVRELTQLVDSAQYYVLMIDSVCPAVPSNVVSIDVVTQLPTAFTPHNSIGMNDMFMEGHKVVIFNRYGQKMVESDNGWDGTCRGELVDPGVYFYEVEINGGERHKGSIEVVYFK